MPGTLALGRGAATRVRRQDVNDIDKVVERGYVPAAPSEEWRIRGERGIAVTRRIKRQVWAVLAPAVLIGLVAGVPVAQATTSTGYTGTTSDANWIADIPSPWNGTLLLYSHGFGPPVAADAPDAVTRQALLARGYALAGSSYDTSGSWWALDTALRDQFDTLTAVEQLLPSAPQHVIAVGTSMGGLISELEDENSNGRLDGALTTCGIVAGGLNLNNYQLDGEYAMTQLLPNTSGAPVELVNLQDNPGLGLQSGEQLTTIAQTAQAAKGQAGRVERARLALAMSLMNVADWAPGQAMPSPFDADAQELGQYNIQFLNSGPPPLSSTMDFVQFARPYIDIADGGGSASWTKGVNFGRLLYESSYAPEVISLYRQAGLNLNRDLEQLTRNANITADPAAIRSLEQTSVPTGRIQVPELDMHTISDQLVPVQQENYYRNTVAFAGRSQLLRQAFIQRQLHCNFNPSELVAGVLAIQHRVNTGHWDAVATPAALQASATSLAAADPSLGAAAFIPFFPPPLSGNNGPFDPFTGGSWPGWDSW